MSNRSPDNIVDFSDTSSPSRLPEPLTRLSEYLDEHRERYGYSQLAKEIAKADPRNENGEPIKLDRRRLTEIVEGKAKALHVRELAALDRYFGQNGTSLAQLLERRTIFDSLASLPTVTLLVGAYPAPQGHHVGDHLSSWWDLRAVTHLTHGAARSSATRWRPEEVWLRWTRDGEMAREDKEASLLDDLLATRWCSELQRHHCGVVAIGSPSANHATEIILAGMEGVEPFERRKATPLDDFRFIWSPSSYRSQASSFSEDGSRISPPVICAARSDNRSHWGVRIRDEVHGIDRMDDGWSAVGIIAAQWRMNGQLRVVLAGSSGPATLACARLLPDIPAVVPQATREEHGTPIWVPVRSRYSSGSEMSFEVSASMFPGEHGVVVGMGGQH
jgi:hypothetical protein